MKNFDAIKKIANEFSKLKIVDIIEQCDYDICKNCAIPRCSNGHKMKYIELNPFVCDGCGINVKSKARFRCSSCDFDLCYNCISGKTKTCEGKELFITSNPYNHTIIRCENCKRMLYKKNFVESNSWFRNQEHNINICFGCRKMNIGNKKLHKNQQELPKKIKELEELTNQLKKKSIEMRITKKKLDDLMKKQKQSKSSNELIGIDISNLKMTEDLKELKEKINSHIQKLTDKKRRNYKENRIC